MTAFRLIVTSNVRERVEKMRGFRRETLGVTIAKALTFTADVVREGEVAEMGRVFDRPTKWTLGGVFRTSATPASLEATVWLKDKRAMGSAGTPAEKFLSPQILGGPRQHKRFEMALIHAGVMPAGMFAVAGDRARLDRYGNVSNGQIIEILSALGAGDRYSGVTSNRSVRSIARRGKQLKDYFVGRPGNGHGPLGIWQRVGTGARPVLIFVKQPQYRARYDFWGVADAIAKAQFDPIFTRLNQRAMETVL